MNDYTNTRYSLILEYMDPLNRGHGVELPLDRVLRDAGIGCVTGGGTGLGALPKHVPAGMCTDVHIATREDVGAEQMIAACRKALVPRDALLYDGLELHAVWDSDVVPLPVRKASRP